MQTSDSQHIEALFKLPFKPCWSLCAVLPRGLYRVVFKSVNDALKRFNTLIFSVLNIVCAIVDVMEYEYLCGAKVPYYGRSTYRH